MKTTVAERILSQSLPSSVQCLFQVSQVMRMTDAETEAFMTSIVPRVIAALPFVAGCDEPERTAIAHLGVYVMALRSPVREVCDHSSADDRALGARLRLISSFKGGDPQILDAGMARLECVMLQGYRRDVGKDSASGEYNPVAAGEWIFEEKLAEAAKRARFGELQVLDVLLPEEIAPMVWWGS